MTADRDAHQEALSVMAESFKEMVANCDNWRKLRLEALDDLEYWKAEFACTCLLRIDERLSERYLYEGGDYSRWISAEGQWFGVLVENAEKRVEELAESQGRNRVEGAATVV